MILIRLPRKRSDDRASAGQQEVTAVLMESFAGAINGGAGQLFVSACSPIIPKMSMMRCARRAGARWLVDGPQTREDYIDIFVLLAGKNHEDPDLGKHKSV